MKTMRKQSLIATALLAAVAFTTSIARAAQPKTVATVLLKPL